MINEFERDPGSTKPAAASSTEDSLTNPRIRLLYAALTIVAVAIGWAGQAVTTRDLPNSLAALGFLDSFFTAYKNASEISAALILLLVASGILAYLSLRWGEPDVVDPLLSTTRPLGGKRRIDLLMALSVAVGLVLWAIFLWALNGDRYEHWLNLVLLAGVILVALPLINRDFIDHKVRWSFNRLLPLHIAFAFGIAGLFIYFMTRDLGSWKYSAVGDEYVTFTWARNIAEGGFFNPWSHRGAGMTLALLTSAGEALFMRLGSNDNVAWKMHNVVITAASFIPFYFLVRELFKTRIAVLALGFFAASHYIFGYAHHVGYLDALLPTTLGLWLFVVGLKRDSAITLFASGLALAMGFYAFEAARAAVVVVSIFMLTFGFRAFRPAVFLPLAGGFILLALPLFATDGPRTVINQMFDTSAVSYASEVTGDRWHRLAVNMQYSFVSFNYSDAGRHYVWGSFADPITAALFAMGLGFVAVRIRQPAYRLLMIWWLVEVAFSGFSNPYPMPPISRLQVVVPPVAVFAAIATDSIMRPFTDLSPLRSWIDDRRWKLATGSLVIAALLIGVLALNLHRFWHETPERFGSPTDEVAVVKASRYPQCDKRNVVVVAHDPGSLLARVFSSYNTNPEPTLLSYPEAIKTLKDIPVPDCLIIQRTRFAEDNPAELAIVVRQVFPTFVETDVTDPSKLRLANLFAPPQP